MDTSQQKCAFVAIIGAPNAGKSTLTNALVGSKVAIVSPKVQTTRARVLGICMADEAQLVLIDTPGIFTPKQRLDKAMVEAAWSAVDADVIAVLVDAEYGIREDTKQIIEGLRLRNKKAILILNKVDALKQKDVLFTLATQLQDTGVFSDIFMISALKGTGVEDVKNYLVKHAPAGAWHYPPDQLTDISERMFAAEVTREQLFLNLHQELPYALMVETEAWEEKPDGSVKISQVVYVQRENQKKIVLGKGGETLKRVGSIARRELKRLWGREVHLFLFVKVREDWKDNPELYRVMGLDFVK